MQITVAQRAGFCYGVRRAVETVERLITENAGGAARIYTLGRLIHNPDIIAELECHGVRAVDESELDGIASSASSDNPVIIVTRAHGVTKQVTEKLNALTKANSSFTFVDCACPSVEKIHRLVESDPDMVTVIIGDENHPEVIGIRSYARGPVYVFPSAETLDSGLNAIRDDKACKNGILMVAQTTHLSRDYKNSQKIIQKLYTKVKIFDTICRVTENRQAEAEELSSQVDLMIVVGGRESSNTNRLYETAKRRGTATLLVENASEVKDGCTALFGHGWKPAPGFKVGITAGASTPRGIIEEVKTIMTDLGKNHTADGAVKIAEEFDENDFAGMLENSLKTINTGETVSGIVTSISPGEVHVDLGTKFTGIIPQTEFSDDPAFDVTKGLKVGDEITAIVTHVSDKDGTATLSKKRADGIVAWRGVIEAYNSGKVIEGKVVEVIKGGLLLDAGSTKLFVPASQSGVGHGQDMNTVLGTKQRARVIEVDEKRRRAVASISQVKREERKALEGEFWQTVEIGKHYTGQVKSLTSYGAFVDLGGVDGMVHSSELSWKRIKSPADVVSIGDTIEVYVKDFDPETKRISLGYKTAEMDPWNGFTSKYVIGDVAEVKIVSLMPFGAFAEVVPGVDGLIHISQLSDRRIQTPAEVVKVGQLINAKIIDVDFDKHKISLSVRALIEEGTPSEEETTDNNGVYYSTDTPEE